MSDSEAKRKWKEQVRKDAERVAGVALPNIDHPEDENECQCMARFRPRTVCICFPELDPFGNSEDIRSFNRPDAGNSGSH